MERRGKGREQVEAVMPVTMVSVATRKPLACRVFDVSADGLCLVVREPVMPGAKLEFVTLYERMPLVVAWCTKSGAKEWRCGLSLAHGDKDLRTIFSSFLSRKLAV